MTQEEGVVLHARPGQACDTKGKRKGGKKKKEKRRRRKVEIPQGKREQERKTDVTRSGGRR